MRAFGDLVPWFVLGVVVAAPLAGLLARRRRRRLGEALSVAAFIAAVRVVTAGTVFAVLAITLRPLGDMGAANTSTNWVPFMSIVELVGSSVDASVAVRNVVFNVLLFVPVGVVGLLLAVQFDRTWKHALAAGIGFSILVEIAQLSLPLGRAVDVDDVLLNSVGVLFGVLGTGALRQFLGGGGGVDSPVGRTRVVSSAEGDSGL